MCLLAVAWRVHPQYRLIVAANRDEFYARDTKAAHQWADHPQVFAGRDGVAGGTWMAVTADGRFAALTNVRGGQLATADGAPPPPSRGALVADFVTGSAAASEYVAAVAATSASYSGFNLLVADGDELWWCSTHTEPQRLEPGVYGLSNASLDTPWPKTTAATMAMRSALSQPSDAAMRAALFVDMADQTLPAMEDVPRSDLPESEMPAERLQRLAACLVRTDDYGTRASSVVTIAESGQIEMEERTIDQTGIVVSTSRWPHALDCDASAGAA
jgi:uncharacterized protein with NRDE domain